MNKIRSALLLLSFVLVIVATFAQSNQIKITSSSNALTVIAATKYGLVRGIADSNNGATFLGIPYAAPPTGNMRWKLPAKPAPWKDTLLTTSYGPSCPQASTDNDPTSEDCLYLNVFTTSDALHKPGTNKPVMFWIHGGGFLGGSAKGYDGRVLANKGVVVVTINYRLGPFGYLHHPALIASAANKGAGNYGLYDQIAALKWVKQNIAAFGGNPGNVTIWGESAGAFSVGALLASPLAKGLFHKAILESGTGLLNGIQTKTTAMNYAVAGARAAGIEGNDSTALKTLYNLSAESLTAMYTRPQQPPLQGFYVWFSPVTGSPVLPLPLDEAITQNKWNKVPLLIGSNMHEGAYFQRESPTTDTAEYYDLLGKKSLGDLSGILKSAYPVKDSSEILSKSQQVVGDLAFGAPARALARMATQHKSRVYLYYFTRTSINAAGKSIKALHSTELPFVFGYTTNKWMPYKWANGVHPGDEFLSDAMSSYWVNFALYGNPNDPSPSRKFPVWPVYEIQSNRYLEIGETIKPMINLRLHEYGAIDKFLRERGMMHF